MPKLRLHLKQDWHLKQTWPARLLLALTLLSLLALGGCAGLLQRPAAPRISLVGVELLSADLFEQRFRLRLRVQNPNAFALPITGLDYTVALNGERFASGVSNKPVTIPAYGEAVVQTEVSSSLGSLLRQLQQLGRGASPGMHYQIKGSLSLENYAFTLPFDYQGELDPTAAGTQP